MNKEKYRQKIGESLTKIKEIVGAESTNTAQLPKVENIPGANVKILMGTDFSEVLKAIDGMLLLPEEKTNPTLKLTLEHYKKIINSFQDYGYQVGEVSNRINARSDGLLDLVVKQTQLSPDLVQTALNKLGYGAVDIEDYTADVLGNLYKHALAPSILDEEQISMIAYRASKEIMESY